ncbi:MAG TPA: DUF2735 domain-containing protein [Tianweitania sediminis]|jgi:hypothetical protein|nr:DUF2735 domain-containing protein [Tianweitania sediminis]
MSRLPQEQTSAKIFQFPLGGRRAAGSEGKAAAASTMRPLVPVMASSGWYHDTEIQSGDHTRKN